MMAVVSALAMSTVCHGDVRSTETSAQGSLDLSSAEPSWEKGIELSGKGRRVTEKLELREGLAVVEVRNDGKSNFVVELLDESGESAGNLFNEINKFQGRRAFNIEKAGEYLLNVGATGAWSFTITQPRPEAAKVKPQTFSGEGMDITPFVKLPKGLAVFEFQRHGEGRGHFTLLDQDGRYVEQIANQLDTFEGSAPVKIEEEGIYLLNVYGDGNWTVTVK
jgi:hypothetical protein